MPSFSISLKNNDFEHSLIAEIVYWNFNARMERFLDRRNDIKLKAHSI
jgi:hypothetical protein